MKNNKLGRVLNRSLLLALTLVFNVLAFAQPTPPSPPIAATGVGATGPGEPPASPIDMYEGLLLAVAVMFIVGMYYYSRRRKLA